MHELSLPTLFVTLIIASIALHSLAQDETLVFPCQTPDNFSAYCISLFNCPHLMTSLATLNPSAIDFVQKSICLGCESGDFKVCCGRPRVLPFVLNKGTSENVTVSVTPTTNALDIKNVTVARTNTFRNKTQRRQLVKDQALPSSTFCGQQHTDYRVKDLTQVDLDEYPWLVQIKVSEEEVEDNYNCGGVIINTEYILTDSLCGQLALSIKVGLYNTAESVVCRGNANIPECTEPAIEYQISDRTLMNDNNGGEADKFGLALLKVNGSIRYTDYVRPICLPVDGSFRPTENLNYAGWGKLDSGARKVQRSYALTSPQSCYEEVFGLRTIVENRNISLACLELQGDSFNDTCVGQHGSPLMYEYKFKWYLDAFSSECSNKQLLSGFFINPHMMNWILDNIEHNFTNSNFDNVGDDDFGDSDFEI